MEKMTPLKLLLLVLFCLTQIVSSNGECTDECVCHGFNYLSQEIVDDLCSLSKYNEQCPVTCKTCHTKTTTTLAPKVTTEPKTATPKTTAKPTTAKPTTAKPTTAKPTTAKPTTAKPTTTKSTTTATPKTDGPVDGVCGDKEQSCSLIGEMSAADQKSTCERGYSDLCPSFCEVCTAPDSQRCANFKDDNYQCSSRNCEHADLVERHRVRKHCAKTCCEKNQIYSDELSSLDEKFHPRLLSLNIHS